MSVGVALALPLLRAEMRSRVRDWRSCGLLTGYLAVLCAVEAVFMLRDAGSATDSALPTGVRLFDLLTLVQFGLLFVLTPLVTAGAVSGERERGTWDLLLTTPLSSFGIGCSKVAARVLFVLVTLVMGLPFVSVAFLYGDLSAGDVVPPYVVMVTAVILLSTATFAISLFVHRFAAALLWSVGAAAFFGFALTFLVATTGGHGWRPYSAPEPGSPISLPASAVISPVAALDSSLPATRIQPVVARTFTLSARVHLWELYALVSLLGSALVLTSSIHFVRLPRATIRGAPMAKR